MAERVVWAKTTAQMLTVAPVVDLTQQQPEAIISTTPAAKVTAAVLILLVSQRPQPRLWPFQLVAGEHMIMAQTKQADIPFTAAAGVGYAVAPVGHRFSAVLAVQGDSLASHLAAGAARDLAPVRTMAQMAE